MKVISKKTSGRYVAGREYDLPEADARHGIAVGNFTPAGGDVQDRAMKQPPRGRGRKGTKGQAITSQSIPGAD